jgi:glycosyltransferase involved in cell wall biosynthesis
VLLAPRGMLGKGAMSLKPLKKNIFILFGRALGLYRNISFHASNPQEELDIRKKFRLARIVNAPNINALAARNNRAEKKSGELRLFFLSRVARVKNLHFALQVLADIPTEVTISYDIFGNAEDPEYMRECSHLISRLPSHIHVKFMGELPFNTIADSLANQHCLFLPTLNENYGHSIVESLLCGCPAIISDQTPWNDLAAANAGAALPLTDSQSFRKAIMRFAKMDQAAFDACSNAANIYISRKIDPERIAGKYESIFRECGKN